MRISDWSSDVCSSDLPIWLSRIGTSGGLFAAVPASASARKAALIIRISVNPQHRPNEPARDIGAQDRRVHIAREHAPRARPGRSEEHTSELQSLMRISYAVFCLNKKKKTAPHICIHHYSTQNPHHHR